jgi:hypothetical protein
MVARSVALATRRHMRTGESAKGFEAIAVAAGGGQGTAQRGVGGGLGSRVREYNKKIRCRNNVHRV